MLVQAFDILNWFVGSADIKNAFHQMRIPGWLHVFIALPAVLASEASETGKTIKQKKVCSRFFGFPCSCNTSNGVLVGDVLQSRCHGPQYRSSGVLILLFSIVVTIALNRCSVAHMAWDPLAFVGRMLTIFGVLTRGANCNDVHLARLIAADVLGYELSPCTTNCSRTSKRIARIRSVAKTVSVRHRISGRATELINGHESLLALSDRGALPILDASCKFARAPYLVSGEPWSTVRMEQRAFGGIMCLFRSDWSLRWLGVCVCSDVSEKGFAFEVREGCRELASEVSRVSERTRFKRSSRSICARSCAVRSFAPDVDLDSSGSDENEVSLARRRTSWRCRCNFFCVGIGGLR